MKQATCSVDGCDVRAAARHLCNRHYLRAQRSGQLDVHNLQQQAAPPVPCSWDGCGRVVEKRGFCSAHYQTWRKANPDKVHRKPANVVCAVDACEKSTHGNGWCKWHYQIWLRTGDPAPQAFVDPGCSVEGCESGHYGVGLCRMHWARMHRTGDANWQPRVPNAQRICRVEECCGAVVSRELCIKHYARLVSTGDPLTPSRIPVTPPCEVEGCDSTSRIRRMCPKHYQRWRRHGDVTVVKRKPSRFGPAVVCSEKGCSRLAQSRGMCTKHYNAWNLSSDYVPTEPQTGMPCVVADCRNGAFASRLCATHYYRRRRYGDVLEHLPVGYMVKPPPPCATDGCGCPQVGRGSCIWHYGALVDWTAENPAHSTASDTADWLAIIAGDPCGYCGGPMEHIDHIHPRSKDGPNHWTNFAPACQWCNMSKRAMSVLDYMLKRLGVENDDVRDDTGGSPRSSGAGVQVAI